MILKTIDVTRDHALRRRDEEGSWVHVLIAFFVVVVGDTQSPCHGTDVVLRTSQEGPTLRRRLGSSVQSQVLCLGIVRLFRLLVGVERNGDDAVVLAQRQIELLD